MPYDVFVSYAHADDEKPARADAGWVTTFVQELKKILRRKLGGDGARVWSDHGLGPNTQLDTTLSALARESRTIVLFMSAGYLRSDWCRLEIDSFLKEHRGDGFRESVFVVEIDETNRATWPERVRQLTAIQLYSTSLGGTPELLGFPNPPIESGSLYWTRLNELAHFICRQLQMEDSQSSVAGMSQSPVRAGETDLRVVDLRRTPPRDRRAADRALPTVWIAEPTPDLYGQWESLASAIRQRDAIVRPLGHSAYPTSNSADLREVVERDLDGCALLVQLLSDAPGVRIPPGRATATALQESVARLHAQTADVTFLKWRSSQIDLDKIADAEHRDLMRGAIASGFEQFRQQVLATLGRGSQPVQDKRQPAVVQGESLSFCVTAGPNDAELSETVAGVIQDIGHAAVTVPPAPEGDQTQTKYRELVEGLLSDVHGVILVHGKEDGLWVKSRHFQFRKILAPKRRGLWGAYIEGPPQDKSLVRITDPWVMALDCRDGVKAKPIREFVDALAGAMSA